MSAHASLPEVGIIPALIDDRPLVLVNGIPEQRLAVSEMRKIGPLDLRSAVLTVLLEKDQKQHFVNTLIGSTATLAQPYRLKDEQIRWAVLVNGKMTVEEKGFSEREDRQVIALKDSWNAMLDEAIHDIWWETNDGLFIDNIRSGVLGTGNNTNRSESLWPINGKLIHVFQENGLPWTVATALETINGLGKLELSLSLVSPEIRELPLPFNINLRQSIKDILTKLLGSVGLIIQRDQIRESNSIVERRVFRPIARGRKVHLAWANNKHALGHVLEIDTKRPTQETVKWITHADGWLVESSFDLIKAWDPGLEGQTDETYSKSDNSDFATYANVFRLWALNEDGQFSHPPYNQGDAFNLTSFFGQGSIVPQHLRFLPALTLDDSETRRQPIVEMSTDGGGTWLSYPGSPIIRMDQAAIYLNDTTLPSEFLAAAQANNAKIRVTASLQSPLSVQSQRWSGNPFSKEVSTQEFQLGDAFRFAKVSSQSIHYEDILAGDLQAIEYDQTDAMSNWLLKQIQQPFDVDNDGQGQARLSLAGTWPMLRIGDHPINVAGPDTHANNQAEAIGNPTVSVRSVRCYWARSNTRQTQRSEIDLVF